MPPGKPMPRGQLRRGSSIQVIDTSSMSFDEWNRAPSRNPKNGEQALEVAEKNAAAAMSVDHNGWAIPALRPAGLPFQLRHKDTSRVKALLQGSGNEPIFAKNPPLEWNQIVVSGHPKIKHRAALKTMQIGGDASEIASYRIHSNGEAPISVYSMPSHLAPVIDVLESGSSLTCFSQCHDPRVSVRHDRKGNFVRIRDPIFSGWVHLIDQKSKAEHHLELLPKGALKGVWWKSVWSGSGNLSKKSVPVGNVHGAVYTVNGQKVKNFFPSASQPPAAQSGVVTKLLSSRWERIIQSFEAASPSCHSVNPYIRASNMDQRIYERASELAHKSLGKTPTQPLRSRRAKSTAKPRPPPSRSSSLFNLGATNRPWPHLSLPMVGGDSRPRGERGTGTGSGSERGGERGAAPHLSGGDNTADSEANSSPKRRRRRTKHSSRQGSELGSEADLYSEYGGSEYGGDDAIDERSMQSSSSAPALLREKPPAYERSLRTADSHPNAEAEYWRRQAEAVNGPRQAEAVNGPRQAEAVNGLPPALEGSEQGRSGRRRRSSEKNSKLRAENGGGAELGKRTDQQGPLGTPVSHALSFDHRANPRQEAPGSPFSRALSFDQYAQRRSLLGPRITDASGPTQGPKPTSPRGGAAAWLDAATAHAEEADDGPSDPEPSKAEPAKERLKRTSMSGAFSRRRSGRHPSRQQLPSHAESRESDVAKPLAGPSRREKASEGQNLLRDGDAKFRPSRIAQDQEFDGMPLGDMPGSELMVQPPQLRAADEYSSQYSQYSAGESFLYDDEQQSEPVLTRSAADEYSTRYSQYSAGESFLYDDEQQSEPVLTGSEFDLLGDGVAGPAHDAQQETSYTNSSGTVGIQVPLGVPAGAILLVEYAGQRLEVEVPAGITPGAMIQVKLPSPNAKHRANRHNETRLRV